MRTNFLKLSFLALAVTVFVTSCSQDETMESAGQNRVLTISTAVQGFTPDATTRVQDVADGDNYNTTFEVNDKIGVTVIMEDGSVICQNMPMQYDGTKWSSASPLYFYKNATYIAYSPYNANVTDATTVENITNYFTNNVLGTASYKESDLMTATVTTGEDITATNLTFNFAHAMSMVEFVIPVSKYETTGGYKYYGPIFKVKLTKKEGDINESDIIPLALGGGVYRALLSPVTAEETTKNLIFKGELMVGDGTQPVYFKTNTSFQPLAGHYKKVTVNYTNAPGTDVVKRDLAVGDYFYADGGIVPSDTEVSKVPKNNLVGIIFSLNVAAADKEHGWKNGYVISTKGTTPKWGNGTALNTYQNWDTEDSKKVFFADMTGYEATKSWKDKNIGVDICNSLKNDFGSVANSTSGWFVPAPGQIISLLKELGGFNASDTEDYTVASGNKNNAVNSIHTKLSSVGMGFLKDVLWTSVEQNPTQMYGFERKANQNKFVTGRNKGDGNKYELRPILAF